MVNGVLTAGTRLVDNLIGVSLDGTAIGNDIAGIDLTAPRVTITGNTIANQPVGIRIDEIRTPTSTRSARNSIFANNTGPRHRPRAARSGESERSRRWRFRAEQQLNFPVITAADTTVTGTACANCVVEVFVADRPAGANGSGKTFLASSSRRGRRQLQRPDRRRATAACR